MKNSLILLLIALLFIGCSESATNMPIEARKIEGVSQKGPFITGSTVHIMELNETTMLQTGRMFKSTIKSDKGDFVLEGDGFYSKYAMIEVNGYYRNEVTGLKSSGPLTLNAITDLSKRENVNVDLLTHLEFERIKHLVSKGKTIKDAKAQAEREILKTMAMDGSKEAFEDLNIFGSGEGTAKLLAISILLQGDEDVAGFTERIGKLAMELAENGTWNDSVTRNAIAEWAFKKERNDEFYDESEDDNLYFDIVITKPYSKQGFFDIRKKILEWGFSDSLPNFRKYISMFWADNFGLGKCSNSNMGDTALSTNPLSPNIGLKFVCDGTFWIYTHKGTSKYKGEFGTLTDARDGHTYKTVQIGEQVWMAENLNYDYQTEITHSLCHDNKQENCDAYGRLYPFAAAVDSAGLFGDGGLGCGGSGFKDNSAGNLKESSRGVCPEGWHLPSKGEWEQLFTTVGGIDKAAKVLSAADEVGTDEYGFNAFDAGMHAYGLGFLGIPGYSGSIYWTSTPYDMTISNVEPDFRSTRVEIVPNMIDFQVNDLGYAVAVRCVMD